MDEAIPLAHCITKDDNQNLIKDITIEEFGEAFIPLALKLEDAENLSYIIFLTSLAYCRKFIF